VQGIKMKRGDEKKRDYGKPMWDLLPLGPIEDIVKVLTWAVEQGEYEKESWKTVDDAKNRYYAALMRHLKAYRDGELPDNKSGLPHLAHAGCCLLFISWLEQP
jgi:hypothetical protein